MEPSQEDREETTGKRKGRVRSETQGGREALGAKAPQQSMSSSTEIKKTAPGVAWRQGARGIRTDLRSERESTSRCKRGSRSEGIEGWVM
eukprot:6199844-Pleurochrysis_carterae.AAC.3